MDDNPFQAPTPEDLAELLPQYDINSFIAQGGMGAVYSGRQSSLDRDVAVKILPREMGEDPEFRESFAAEAKAMARLNHPNLIGVFDCGDVDGMPYIVMEYVEGCSLHESAFNQVIEPAQAIEIVKGICDGLAHAHEHGIVHRDIKPANILLTLKAEPKIGDFGLARATDADTPGLVMGTPGYTAPEVFYDPAQAGPLADIYSVGVILHQLLTGIDPAGSEGPPTQPTGNIRVDAIWRKATSIHPAHRYASAAEMSSALQKWMDNKPGIATQRSAANHRATRSRTPHRPEVVGSGGSGGAGVLVNVCIIAILGVSAVFAYQYFKNDNGDVRDSIVASGDYGMAPLSNQNPAPDQSPVVVPPAAQFPAPPVDPHPDQSGTTDDAAQDRDAEYAVIGGASGPGDGLVVETDPEEPSDAGLEPGDLELLERAVGLIEEARAQREKEFAENARRLIFQLGGRARSARSHEAELLKQLEQDVADNRVPIVEDIYGLPEDVARLFTDAHKKEEEIESNYLESLTRVRDAYVTRLEAAGGEASDEGLQLRLLAQAEQAGDLDSWVGLLSPEPDMERTRSSGAFGGGFAGRWNAQTDNLTQWVADADGVVTINDGQWKGATATWKSLDDGGVEIHWPDKPRPYRLSRDGTGWSGTTAYGHSITVTRGDW